MTQLVGKGNHIDNVKEGPWEYFTDNGQLVKKGAYKNGLMSGVWEFYTLFSGREGYYGLHKRINFKDGLEDGLCQKIRNGKTIEIWHLKDQIKDGSYEAYFDDGRIKKKGVYKNGYKVGEWLMYYKDGQLYEKQFWNCVECWHDSEKFYVNGSIMEKGRFRDTYISSCSENFVDGKVFTKINFEYDYDVLADDPDFLKKILASRSNYQGGTKDGPWEYYFENGNIKERGKYKSRNVIDVLSLDDTLGLHFLHSSEEQDRNKNTGKDGQWNTFSELGNPIETTNFKAGVKNGESRVYYSNRNLIDDDLCHYYSIQNFKDGQAHGQWTEYYSNGNIRQVENYVDDMLNGVCEYYLPNEVVKDRVNWQDGKRSGKCEYFFDDGKLEICGFWKQNYKDGEWRYFDDQGELKGINIWSCGIEVEGCFIDKNYKKNLTNHLLNGQFETYYDNGNVCEKGNFDLGKRDGVWEYYNVNGVLDGKGVWKNGKKFDGYFVDYHDNCILESISNYKNGLKNGFYEEYDFGELSERGEYKEGSKNGYFEKYLRGVLVEKGGYLNGMETGLWEYFDKEGELEKKGGFIEGKMNGIWEVFYQGRVFTEEH